MDETSKTRDTVRAYVESLELRDWAWLGSLLAQEVVYELPQTRERIHGKSAYLWFNQEYPGDWHLTVRRVIADGRHAAAWLDTRVGNEHQDACVWFDLSADGLIEKITDYWPDPYEPPEGREHLTERW